MGVATRTKKIMVSSPNGNERTWTFQKLPEDKRCDAEAVMSLKASPFGTEFKLKITADPVNTEPVDRAQARPVIVVPFRARHKDIVQFGFTPGARDAEPQEEEPVSRQMTKFAEREC